MIQFKPLNTTPLPQLVATFNEAFAQYMIPIQLNEEMLRHKVRIDRIDLAHSMGAFANEQLVGFILTGTGKWEGLPTAYNAGTGVIPAFRGQQLTTRMYDQLFPLFKKAGVQQCLLEVIDTNERAIGVYKKLGFQQQRSFDCVKGAFQAKGVTIDPAVQITVATKLPWDELNEFWNYAPSWQNHLAGVLQIWKQLVALEVRVGGQLVGYAVKNRQSGRIMQFGIHPEVRGQGIGRYLFYQLSRIGNPKMSAINLDKRDASTLAALHRFGLTSFIGQLELLLSL
ncbi:MAG: GNAT family N-acetyltransferase [Bacteroidota bacterium]